MHIQGFQRCLGMGILTCAAAAAPACSIADQSALDESFGIATSELTIAALTLQNGWTNAPYSTRDAGVSLDSGIVHLQGAIANGASAIAFTRPAGYRPATDVYVPVDLCSATKGRLWIQPSGVVSVQAEGGAFSNAQCFTSLEGASFAPSASSFTALALQNGWTHAPYSTSSAAVSNIGGIVYFKGAIAGGGSQVAFTLPSGFRPATDVHVPVDLCNAANGRLWIQPSGVVSVQTKGAFSDAQCFTSLDGASFAQSTSIFTALTLQNGWMPAPYSTGAPGVADIGGIVHFKGAIANGASAAAFTLPSAFRPLTDVYVSVDLCNVTKGRLLIQPSGLVSVMAEGGAFSNAQCFTSLDGVHMVNVVPPEPDPTDPTCYDDCLDSCLSAGGLYSTCVPFCSSRCP
jgi:hypothetical protein